MITNEFSAPTGLSNPAFYRESMCAHEKLHVGMVGCCLDNNATPRRIAINSCNYNLERTSFAWGLKLCRSDIWSSGDMCDWTQVNSDWECREDLPENWFWTNQEECIVKAKGELPDVMIVAIVNYTIYLVRALSDISCMLIDRCADYIE